MASSMCRSFSLSPWSMRPAGMPVHADTTSAISSAPTLSAIIGAASGPDAANASSACSAASASSSSRCTCGISPYCRRPAVSRSPSRIARSTWTRSSSSFARSSPTRLWPAFSASHRAVRAASSSRRSARSARSFSRRSSDAGSVDSDSTTSSISRRVTARCSSSISIGDESSSMRRRDAASSTRSIALSGSWRPVMYRSESDAAATSAESAIVTLWCASYRSLSPRRIATVSSTEGSPTNTCWNRRSSTGSFSMYSRYSSSVVAPTRRSSPRASIGLSMLPASMAPSPPAPAPTTVCSSSMNVTTSPSEDLISSRTALRRSSNSPRYFAPATMLARSSDTRRFPWSEVGTSPATMRWARPSTTAVLPTPGSPMSTGLFLVRRLSTCTTRRISESRPMTGSSLPSAARAVRSVPYCSSAL